MKKTEKSIIDRNVESNWKSTYEIDDENHYVVSIPLKNPDITFPDNREYALDWLRKIIRNLKSKNAFESYKSQILSMIADGYAEKGLMGLSFICPIFLCIIQTNQAKLGL